MARKAGRKSKGGAGRGRHVRVKTARGRKTSSTRWLQRQLNDPYVREAQRLGYRSRAAFKLAELDDRFGFLEKGTRVIDLGAAPGGWSQVAAERLGDEGRVFALDIAPIEPLAGVEIFEGDFYDDRMLSELDKVVGMNVDVVLSDMAASATGHAKTDHLRIMALAEAAYDFAWPRLSDGGCFVAKVFQGGTERELLERLKRDFAKVVHAKPDSSRKESAEMYLVATGFRGNVQKDDGER
ncbi:MAG: rRNA methyltransferase [Rhodospirillaceae bacterium]|nr:rRNA methyltransferase [Rhodospirillaceae bacterium]HAA92587.1 rRNA methyltransferase [Rhodospirillaceae bacterium]